MTAASSEIDYLVIGGGFYGCCLALFLRSVSDRITVVEAGATLMTRASRVNQARVHTGFHYPRSVLTAVKSMVLHQRFARDFSEAVKSDFRMLYAVARRHSKVSAGRFHRMYADMGAPIAPATASQAALFNPETIEAVFDCTEYAFDYSVLRDQLMARLDMLGMDLRLNTEVVGLAETPDGIVAELSDGREIRARYVFNVTYSNINRLLRGLGLPEAQLKHELTEIALIVPPDELAGIGITVMDGPFFSTMPYPAENLYSLTHVRYTPHLSWHDGIMATRPYALSDAYRGDSRARHMILDSQRYAPCLAGAEVRTSLYTIKTVLLKNESDDGRPILFQRRPRDSRVISIMGGKIDNIYDLFDLLRDAEPEWAGADSRFLLEPAA